MRRTPLGNLKIHSAIFAKSPWLAGTLLGAGVAEGSALWS